MGYVHVRPRIENLTTRKGESLSALVDTGARFMMVPAPLLRRLGILPERRQRFQLANGRKVSFWVGDARVSIGRRVTASPVIFGPRRSEPLIGVLTLEALGLRVDPVRQRLRPTKMLLV